MRKFDEIRIENTNRCGYKCVFCPRDALTRVQGIMPVEDLAVILERLPDSHSGGVDLHGFGEPLLDGALIEKARMVRQRWPEARIRIYSTLGINFSPTLMENLAASDIDEIHVSLYGHDAASYELIHGKNRWTEAHANLGALTAALEKKGGEMKVIVRRTPIHDEKEFGGEDERSRETLEAGLKTQGVDGFVERTLHNYGRGRAYNEPNRQAVCSVVGGLRSRILTITWDLFVLPCSFDFNADIKLGNLRTQSLEEIFCGEPYETFIGAHKQSKEALYAPCASCEKCLAA